MNLQIGYKGPSIKGMNEVVWVFFLSAFYGVLLNQHNGYPSIVLFITMVSNLLFTRLSPLLDYEYKKRGPVFY